GASMRWVMSRALTEEHLALAESVRGWAGHTAPATTVRAVVDAEDRGAAVSRDTLRPGLAAQGLLGLHLPEALGGQGYGLPELAVATEELGRAMVPGGFLPTALAGAILASAVAGADEADTSALEGLVKELAAGTRTGAGGAGTGRAGRAGRGGGAGDGGQLWPGARRRPRRPADPARRSGRGAGLGGGGRRRRDDHATGRHEPDQAGGAGERQQGGR